MRPGSYSRVVVIILLTVLAVILGGFPKSMAVMGATSRSEIERRLALPPFAYVAETEHDYSKIEQGQLEVKGALAFIDSLKDVLVDRPENGARFLALGSASPDIVRGASETLAGRAEFVELHPFDLTEAKDRDRLWLRGGFPRSFLADTAENSRAWREGFIRTFLERDLAQLGIRVPAPAMRRFWTMLAHLHGQTLNSSEIGRSLGISDKTVRSYLDILTGTFMMRQLQPWHENLGKRQVKSPKIYFRDTGLLHGLLEIGDRHALLGHPRLGASWEGFAVEQIARRLAPSEVYFWATHGGAELDLFFLREGRRFGVECKFSEAPQVRRSMRVAKEDLSLDHLWIVHPGEHSYPIDDGISAVPLGDYVAGL